MASRRRPARLDYHSYSTATLAVSDLRLGNGYFPGGRLIPFGTSYPRMKADEYRALAAAMNDGPIRLQLLNMAERYDRDAEQNECPSSLRRSSFMRGISSTTSSPSSATSA